MPMPKKNNKINATLHLIDDYDKKKQFFKDTVLNEPVDKFLKEHLKCIVPGDELSIFDSIKSIKIYVRQIKFLRTELEDVNEKLNLFVCLKRIKPNGMYVSEFLVRHKVNLFLPARLCQKQS